MAISRPLALLSLGTILLCFLFTRAAVADSDYGDDIHAVRHSSPSADCKGQHPDKGDQCREENDDVDDDFDDTYKIVNNIAVTLSASGGVLREAEKAEDSPGSEEEAGNLFIVGH